MLSDLEPISKPEQSIFHLPISYLSDKQPIKAHIKTDLELIVKEGEKSLYDTVFQPTTAFAKQTVPLWAEYYTSNKEFIQESQQLVKALNVKALNNNIITINELDVLAVYEEIEKETGFIEKYHYMDWKRFKEFNNSASFLQLLSLYNMTSPLLSLSVPIFFLIFPFIMLKIQGIPISLTKYVEVLKMLFKQHQLGKIFTIGSASWDKVIYIVASFCFYILQVYQNVTSCIKYYRNMKKIHAQLFTMREYAKQTLENMTVLTTLSSGLTTYVPFLENMNQHKDVLERMVHDFDQVVPNGFSFQKIKQIGHVMKCFYQLYNKAEYKESLAYSFGLHGYLANLQSLGERYREKQINACKINNQSGFNNLNKRNNNKNKTKFTDAYFPTLVDADPVKNSYTLDKHLLITGPNAAGKTTLLKTTIFNVLFSQQTGFGFYKKANLILYDEIHCYINIPDTSARDSLFQAEARRCKEILDSLAIVQQGEEEGIKHKEKQHLCVFDELYSGTNPYEAIGSAYAFLSYLNKYSNVNFVLTTHYLELCKRLDKQPGINNYHMEVEERDQDLKYTYKLKKHISTIKGGVKVLRDLNYPPEIIKQTIDIITHF